MNQIMFQQDRDPLTGLCNSKAASDLLRAWQLIEGPGKTAPIHAILLTLKRFSAVNLAYGENAGDQALVEIASRITNLAREELEQDWLVSRVRGGTFLVAANQACSRERWQWFAEELADAISQPTGPASDHEAIRLWPRMALLRAVQDETPQRMLSRMGEALEQDQHNPGQRFTWVDGTTSLPSLPAQQLEADLLSALHRDEIEVLYQPQFSCKDNSLIGAEALARWQHPQVGQIGAAALFAIAERADHVGQLSRHIARKALAGARPWASKFRLSLNITSADLASHDFADVLVTSMLECDISPDQLTLEITEQALVPDLERSAGNLQSLADLGIRIALDDFGAGFCNFRYLKILPLHYIKLDRSMVEDIADDPRDLAVLQAIMAMAGALDLQVVAEGIEQEAQRAAVASEKCLMWQGFLGARPMSAEDFLKFSLRYRGVFSRLSDRFFGQSA